MPTQNPCVFLVPIAETRAYPAVSAGWPAQSAERRTAGAPQRARLEPVEGEADVALDPVEALGVDEPQRGRRRAVAASRRDAEPVEPLLPRRDLAGRDEEEAEPLLGGNVPVGGGAAVEGDGVLDVRADTFAALEREGEPRSGGGVALLGRPLEPADALGVDRGSRAAEAGEEHLADRRLSLCVPGSRRPECVLGQLRADVRRDGVVESRERGRSGQARRQGTRMEEGHAELGTSIHGGLHRGGTMRQLTRPRSATSAQISSNTVAARPI